MNAYDDEDIIAALRTVNPASSPVDVAEELDALRDGHLTQGALVTYFKRAFPETPLRVLLDAGGWSRLSAGGLTDEDFNEMLRAWIPAVRGAAQ